MKSIRAIILSGGSGSRLYPVTKGISKQMLPIYSKPMIYYPLSVLMIANIRDILIITTPEDQSGFKRLLGDGTQFGINLSYAIQEKPEGLAQAFTIARDCGFLSNDEPCAMILGDNIFHGPEFSKKLKQASKDACNGIATIFGTPVKDPKRFGIAEVDENGNVLSIEEKPEEPKSNICVTGLYFYPAGISNVVDNITPSERGELEITSVNQLYLLSGSLKLQNLGLGFAWLDTGTFDSLSNASNYVEVIEKTTGKQIACLEEIAFKNGWIDREKLFEIGTSMKKNEYGQYLLNLLN